MVKVVKLTSTAMGGIPNYALAVDIDEGKTLSFPLLLMFELHLGVTNIRKRIGRRRSSSGRVLG